MLKKFIVPVFICIILMVSLVSATIIEPDKISTDNIYSHNSSSLVLQNQTIINDTLELLGNVDGSTINITGFKFFGQYNWNIDSESSSYLSFNGTSLSFNLSNLDDSHTLDWDNITSKPSDLDTDDTDDLITSTNFGGDVSGTYDNIIIADNSHLLHWDNVSNKPANLDIDSTDDITTSGGTITGNLIINGNLQLIGDWFNATVTNQYLNGTFYPSLSDTFDIGSSTTKWNYVYANYFVGSMDWSNLTNLPTNLDTDSTNDLITTTNFGGDVTGTYNNLQINNDSVNLHWDNITNKPTNLDTDSTDDITTTNIGNQNVNSSDYWDNYNTPSEISVSTLINDAGYITLANVTDTNTQKGSIGPYLYNDTSDIYFNDTKLNETIELLDDDTTYSNGTGINQSGTVFSIDLGYFQGLFIESGSNVIGDTEINYTEVTLNDFTNDAGFITSYTNTHWSINRTSLQNQSGILGVNETWLDGKYAQITDLFSESWNDLTDIPAGFSDNIDNDTTYTNLSEFNNDVGFITSYIDTNTNCSVDGSCENIVYESELNYTVDTDTTYSHLSNFTDNLGDRGYTHLSNFTDDLGYVDTNTHWEINETVLDNQSGTLGINSTYFNLIYINDDETTNWDKDSSDDLTTSTNLSNAHLHHWDNITNKPTNLDIDSTNDITTSNIGSQNVNSSTFWDNYDTPGDIGTSQLNNDANFIANGTSATLTDLFVDTNLIYATGDKIGFLTSSPSSEHDFDFNGNVRIQGNLDVLGNLTSLSVENLNINGSIIPEQDSSFTIGNTTHRYQYIYVSDDIYVNGLSVCLEDGTNCYMGTLINTTELEDGTIINADISDSAAIEEVKLNLNYGTTTLYNLIQSINYTHLSNFTDDLDYSTKNVNSSEYWDTYNNPSDIQNMLTIPCGNISGATSDLCTLQDTDTDTQKGSSGPYLYNDSTMMYFNESKLNNTIGLLDTDTTYTNGDGLVLTNNQFNISLSYFQNLFIELTDSFGGDVSGTYDNIQLGLNVVGDGEINYTQITLSDFNNDMGFLNSSNTSGWDTNVADDFSGSWNDLSNIPAGFNDDIDNDTTYTNLSEFNNDAGFITSYTDTNTNCSVDGSCSLITYDSELTYTVDTNTNCSIDNSCGLITYDSELTYTVDTNETTRVNDLYDNTSNWNEAYGWGDHSSEGYITSYVNTNCSVDDSCSLITYDSELNYTIDTNETDRVNDLYDNTSNWNTAYTWGDHSTQSYLKNGSSANLTTLDVNIINLDEGRITGSVPEDVYISLNESITLSTNGNDHIYIDAGSSDINIESDMNINQNNIIGVNNITANNFNGNISCDYITGASSNLCTITDTDTDTIWTISNEYIYNNSGVLTINETKLNATITSISGGGCVNCIETNDTAILGPNTQIKSAGPFTPVMFGITSHNTGGDFGWPELILKTEGTDDWDGTGDTADGTILGQISFWGRGDQAGSAAGAYMRVRQVDDADTDLHTKWEFHTNSKDWIYHYDEEFDMALDDNALFVNKGIQYLGQSSSPVTCNTTWEGYMYYNSGDSKFYGCANGVWYDMVSNATSSGNYVLKSGGTITGDLTLEQDLTVEGDTTLDTVTINDAIDGGVLDIDLRDTIVGGLASVGNTGYYTTCVGVGCAIFNDGNYSIGIGPASLNQNDGDNVIAIGYESGQNNNDDNVLIIRDSTLNAVPIIWGELDNNYVAINGWDPRSELDVNGMITTTDINITNNIYLNDVNITNVNKLTANELVGNIDCSNITGTTSNICTFDSSTYLLSGSNIIGDTEMNYTEVTLADFTNDAGFITSSESDTIWNITGSDYIINESGILDINKTKLNSTIESISLIDNDDIGDNEMNYSEVTLSDFTNDAGFASSFASTFTNITVTNIISSGGDISILNSSGDGIIAKFTHGGDNLEVTGKVEADRVEIASTGTFGGYVTAEKFVGEMDCSNITGSDGNLCTIDAIYIGQAEDFTGDIYGNYNDGLQLNFTNITLSDFTNDAGFVTVAGSRWNITGSNYIYNTTDVLHINETKLNDTIDARAGSGIGNITNINALGYVYGGGSSGEVNITFNASGYTSALATLFINQAGEFTGDVTGSYLGGLEFNETALNASIDARGGGDITSVTALGYVYGGGESGDVNITFNESGFQTALGSLFINKAEGFTGEVTGNYFDGLFINYSVVTLSNFTNDAGFISNEDVVIVNVNNDGKIGLGILPVYTLDINSTYNQLRVANPTGGAVIGLQSPNGTASIRYDLDGEEIFSLYNNKVKISDTGQVSMGTDHDINYDLDIQSQTSSATFRMGDSFNTGLTFDFNPGTGSTIKDWNSEEINIVINSTDSPGIKISPGGIYIANNVASLADPNYMLKVGQNASIVGSTFDTNKVYLAENTIVNGLLGVNFLEEEGQYPIDIHLAGGSMAIRTTDSAIIDGDPLGYIHFRGDDSGTHTNKAGAVIYALADGEWNGTVQRDAPTRLQFHVQGDGAIDDLTDSAFTLKHDSAVFDVTEVTSTGGITATTFLNIPDDCTSFCEPGDIGYNTTHICVCTATDTWQSAILS